MKKIIDLLFKYNTENTEQAPSPNILPCLKNFKEFFTGRGIHSELRSYKVAGSDGKYVKHGNLTAYNPRKKKKYIMFQGHIDTVPVNGKHVYKIEKGILTGRGAADMKGQLAGMVDAFIKLYDEDTEYAPLLLITGDEEANNFAGIRNFLGKNDKEIIFAINGEATNFTLSDRMKGVIMFDISQKTGITGHSSLANRTLIEDAIPLLDSIGKFLDRSRAISKNNFGSTTAAFTMLNSGIKSNQLPDSLALHFHLRTVEKSKEYLSCYDKIIGLKLGEKYNAAINSIEPVEIKIPEDIEKKFADAFRHVGAKIDRTVFAALSEATLLNQSGILTAVCGPGDIANAHRNPEAETMPLESLKRYSEFLQKFME